nr:unnamed protein product [Callosobruchus chinensis]
MDYVYPTKVDRIGFLSTSSIKSATYRTSSAGSTKSSRTSARDYVDTVHYLSPATTITAARTEYEGDLAYQHLLDAFRPEAANLSIGDLRSTLSSVSTKLGCEDALPQRTLAIVKPEAMKYQDVVLRAVKEAGLKILAQRVIHLTPEQVSEIYQKHYGSPAFPNMVVSVSVSPVLVLSLAGQNAVEKWKSMVGPYEILREEWFFPYSVRTRFGIINDMPDVLHASEDVMEAKAENRYFYPRSILEPIAMEEDKVSDFISQFVRPTLVEGLAQVVYKKPIDPVLFLAEWLLLNNPYQMPERVALTPL